MVAHTMMRQSKLRNWIFRNHHSGRSFLKPQFSHWHKMLFMCGQKAKMHRKASIMCGHGLLLGQWEWALVHHCWSYIKLNLVKAISLLHTGAAVHVWVLSQLSTWVTYQSDQYLIGWEELHGLCALHRLECEQCLCWHQQALALRTAVGSFKN